MIWFLTLVGFWLAFFTAGLISAVIATFLLTRMSARFFGCIQFGLYTIISYFILFGVTYFLVPREYWDPAYDPQELELSDFVKGMSPSLHQRITELQSKQLETTSKIKKLMQLRKERSNFAEQINVEIAKWEELSASIDKTLDRIHEQTEKAFVDYQIDEISGRERFSNVSSGLQDEATRVLNLAGVLQSSIEKQSPRNGEKNQQNKAKSLEDLLNEMEED